MRETETERERQREISLTELAYSITGAGESKICKMDWQPGELMLQYKPKDPLLTEFLPDQRKSVFLLKSSTDWMRSTHIMEGDLLYSESTNLNINVIQKTPSQKHPN